MRRRVRRSGRRQRPTPLPMLWRGSVCSRDWRVKMSRWVLRRWRRSRMMTRRL
uniref:Uncharacterized protein n=1 Tax=Arundo donax TaxID=35708 RepID=A0A0A9ERC0_ARUDO